MPKSAQIKYISDVIGKLIGKPSLEKISNEKLLGLFMVLSGKLDETTPLDSYGRILAENSKLKDLKIADKPIINLFLKKQRKNLNLWPDGKTWAVGLSHDVDMTEKYGVNFYRYFIYMDKIPAQYRFSHLWRAVIGLKRSISDRADYWNFEKIIDLEKKYGFRSTLFFAGSNFFETTCPYDFVYRINEPKFKRLFQRLKSESFEIGLHASFESSNNGEQFLKEKKTLEKQAKTNISGIRMHFWHLDWRKPHETFRYHQKAGFFYDSSLAFNDEPGFARGIALPYHPWDEKEKKAMDLLEIPPTLMDSQVMQKEQPLKMALNHLKIIKEVGGLAVLDWHNHVFDEKDFPGWGNVYEKILEVLAGDKSVWVAPMGEIYKWWVRKVKSQK